MRADRSKRGGGRIGRRGRLELAVLSRTSVFGGLIDHRLGLQGSSSGAGGGDWGGRSGWRVFVMTVFVFDTS